MRPAPPVCGACVRGFWPEQAHADHPAVVIDALDEVPVQLELGDDGGPERDPVGCSSAKATGWSPAWRSRSSSRCCWGSAGVIDVIVALQRDWGSLEVSEPRCCHLTFSDWGFCCGPRLRPSRSTHALCDLGEWRGDVGARSRPKPGLRGSRDDALATSGSPAVERCWRRPVMLV